MTNSLLLLSILLLVFVSVCATEAFSSRSEDIKTLTVENFNQSLQNQRRLWLVELYLPWCSVCKRFAPIWKAFAHRSRGWRHFIQLAVMDCDRTENRRICNNFSRDGSYPYLQMLAPFGGPAQGMLLGGNHTMMNETTAIEYLEGYVTQFLVNLSSSHNSRLQNAFSYFRESTSLSAFREKSTKSSFSFLVVDKHNSLEGQKVVLDLSLHIKSNRLHLALASPSSELAGSLPALPLPSLYRYEDQRFKNILSDSSRQKIVQKIAAISGADLSQQDGAEKVITSMSPFVPELAVTMDDLETTLHHMLYSEVSNLNVERFEALRFVLDALVKYFPARPNVRNFLNNLDEAVARLDKDKPVTGDKWKSILDASQKLPRALLSSDVRWRHCKGSKPNFRGYPCGVWILAHTLTIRRLLADEANHVEPKPPGWEVPKAFFLYIKHFFGCRYCRNNFVNREGGGDFMHLATAADAVLFLWDKHNNVSHRLSGKTNDDPYFKKTEFPTQEMCPKCRDADSNFDNQNVLAFLKKYYDIQPTSKSSILYNTNDFPASRPAADLTVSNTDLSFLDKARFIRLQKQRINENGMLRSRENVEMFRHDINNIMKRMSRLEQLSSLEKRTRLHEPPDSRFFGYFDLCLFVFVWLAVACLIFIIFRRFTKSRPKSTSGLMRKVQQPV